VLGIKWLDVPRCRRLCRFIPSADHYTPPNTPWAKPPSIVSQPLPSPKSPDNGATQMLNPKITDVIESQTAQIKQLSTTVLSLQQEIARIVETVRQFTECTFESILNHHTCLVQKIEHEIFDSMERLIKWSPSRSGRRTPPQRHG
jgi:hypothetical protein